MATSGAEQVASKRKIEVVERVSECVSERVSERVSKAEDDGTDTLTHSQANANKSQHHFLVAAWLVSTMGQGLLRARGGYVVDVAGGLGKLDYELGVRYGVRSVLIDPKFSEEIEDDSAGASERVRVRRSTLQISSMLRRKMKKLTRSRAMIGTDATCTITHEEDRSPLMSMLRLSGLQTHDDGLVLPQVTRSIQDNTLLPFDHIPEFFPLTHTEVLADSHLLSVLSAASFIIGVHPDQVTECIVDIAIQLKIPFAVIPCCVFTKLFPERKTQSGETVRTYEELVAYIKGKHPNIVQGILPFYGRNIVLYCKSFD